MFSYYLRLALASLLRSPVVSGFMVLAIGLGIGSSMTMLTVLHVISGDPIPARSARLFYPQIDPLPLDFKLRGGPDPRNDFTWPDAQNLLHDAKAERQAAMAGASLVVRPAQSGATPFFSSGRYTTADFFAMFGVPFRYGSGWSAAEDDDHARVVVLNARLSQRLFGDENPVGKTVNFNNTDFRVIGELDDWRPKPRFYDDHSARIFEESDEFFIVLSTAVELDLTSSGSMSCWGSGGDKRASPKCSWLQFWVQLSDPERIAAYRHYLVDYSGQQKRQGAFERPADVRLDGLMDHLRRGNLVPGDVRLQLWLAMGFLVVCMLNIVGLMLAKFLRRAPEVSVRRALGARRRDIFAQFGAEALGIGLAGGALALLLAQLGLWTVRQRPDDYARLAQMDAWMMLATLALAIFASVLAGMLPALRVCMVPPALQMKSL